MKKSILSIILLVLTSQGFAVTYRKPVTAHYQLTSTGTLTHASLESTLTAVNEATTTLKGITDAHAATLVQVGTATGTLAGMIGSGAGDNLGNHVATTTLNMGFNELHNVSVIKSTADIVFQTMFEYGGPNLGGFRFYGNFMGTPMGGLYIDNGGITTIGQLISLDSNLNGATRINGYINTDVQFRNSINEKSLLLGREGFVTTPGSITANGGFYGDVSNCTGFPAGDNLGNHVATTTLNMNGNVIDGITRINTPFDNDLGWYKPLIIGGDTSQGFATGVRVINFNSPSYMGNSELTMQWVGNPFLYFNDGGWNSYSKGIFYYDPTVYKGTPALQISSNNVVVFGNCTAPRFYGDVSNCTGFPASSPSYFTVSPSTGIDAGTLADGVKVTTANVQATGTGDYLKKDGTWTTPTCDGDMKKATEGVAIAEATATLKGITDAHTATLVQVGVDTETLAGLVGSWAGDNLGNHTATTTLEMGNYALKSSSCIYIGTPFSNEYDLAVVGDVLFSTGTLYLRDTTLLLSDTTGLFMVLVDSETHQTEMYVDGGSTLSIAGVGGFKSNVSVNGDLYADNIYGHFVDTVSITSNIITVGSTNTFVTTASTQMVSGLQTQSFTISSATVRVNGGTSATIRLFITAKNSEYDVSAATPIWSSAVTAGTAHTGGTLVNVSVASDQCITAVIDGISGAVNNILVWVRGTR